MSEKMDPKIDMGKDLPTLDPKELEKKFGKKKSFKGHTLQELINLLPQAIEMNRTENILQEFQDITDYEGKDLYQSFFAYLENKGYQFNKEEKQEIIKAYQED